MDDTLATSSVESTSPLVSVIVLTYNHEPFVGEALQSILQQRLDAPMEVIIADDASTDATRSVIGQVATADPRVQLLSAPINLGAQRNLRRALSVATGRYVAMLEGDDYWCDPDKIRLQAALLDNDPTLSASGHLTNELRMLTDGTSMSNGKLERGVRGRDRIGTQLVLDGCFPHWSSLVYRRELLPVTPPWFDDMAMADWPMCMLLTEHGDIGIIDRAMSTFRRNPSSSYSPLTQLERTRLQVRASRAYAANAAFRPDGITRLCAETQIRLASLARREGRWVEACEALLHAARSDPATVMRFARRIPLNRYHAAIGRWSS